MGEAAIQIGPERSSAFLDRVKEMLPEGGNLDLCLTCGACASGCPATGLHGMDPRKFLRMAALGLDEEITSTPWLSTCNESLPATGAALSATYPRSSLPTVPSTASVMRSVPFDPRRAPAVRVPSR